MAVAARVSKSDFESSGIWLALGLAFVAAGSADPQFRELGNLANILRQSSVLGVLAIGQTFVIAAGMIDLSIGMTAGLVVVLSCSLINGDTMTTLPVAALMLLVGAAVGAVNGILLNRLKLHPLILTFGMLSVLQGLIFTYTDRSIGRSSEPLRLLANGDVLGIPISWLLLLALMTAAHLIFARARFGYHLLAAGGNPESARRAGIDVDAIRLSVFVISGFSAAIAGLLLAGRLGTGYPLAGSGLELDAIVAVVLGGTALSGGRGSVVRALAGVVLLSVISNVLNLLEVSTYVQMFIKGMIVIFAILLNQPRRANA
jgi:ribose transport system permease protein